MSASDAGGAFMRRIIRRDNQMLSRPGPIPISNDSTIPYQLKDAGRHHVIRAITSARYPPSIAADSKTSARIASRRRAHGAGSSSSGSVMFVRLPVGSRHGRRPLIRTSCMRSSNVFTGASY